MDALRTIQRDGYRYEDLTPENRRAVDYMRALVQDFEDGFCYGEDEPTGYTTLDRIISDVAGEVIGAAERWLEITIAEIQISMIESQDV